MMLTRRRFLTLTGGLIALAALAACSGDDSEPEVEEVAVPAGQVPEAGNEPFHSEPGKFYLIHNDDGLLALYTRCTHQGCTVEWKPDDGSFNCPCHGSRFDRHGEVLRGPASRPLDLMQVEVRRDGEVLVRTGVIKERERWEPDQSVPV